MKQRVFILVLALNTYANAFVSEKCYKEALISAEQEFDNPYTDCYGNAEVIGDATHDTLRIVVTAFGPNVINCNSKAYDVKFQAPLSQCKVQSVTFLGNVNE